MAERYGLPEAAACAYAGTEAQKTEDSFTANYDRAAAGKAKKPRVFHLTGLKTDADPLYLEYHLSASAVHAAAKDAGVSVTSYLIAAVICAVRATMTARDRRRAIHLDVARRPAAASSARPPCATSSGSLSSPTPPAMPMRPWSKWPPRCSAS